MAQSFREIVRNDDSLLHLLSLIDKKAIDNNGEIRIGDFQGTCTKITTINTKNPREYSRRIAWTLTGRLLLGLTTYHDMQVRLVLEESRQLLSKCGKSWCDIEKIKKRKIKQVTTKSKNKKARTVEEFEEEETEHETVRFWEVPLVLDEIDITTLPDTTLALADRVTLRDIEAPTVPDFVGIDASLENGFGDNAFGVFEDDEQEDGEVPPFGVDLDGIRSNESTSIVSHGPYIDFDENMNDIVDADIDQASNASELTPIPPVQEPIVRRKENPLNLLAKASPLAPPAVAAVRGGRGKRRYTVFKDEDKTISDDLMIKRTHDKTIGCQDRRSNLMTKDKQEKLKKVDIFSLPAINGSYTRELFSRLTKMRPMDVDWTIIQDAFGTTGQTESNGSDGSIEVDILQNENGSRIQTRSSSRLSRISDSVPLQPVLTSTPIRLGSSQQSVNDFHAPRSQSLSDASIPPEVEDIELMPPPSPVVQNVRKTRNASQNGIASLSRQESLPNLNEDNLPEIEFNESPPIEHHDLASLLGENSLEYQTMQKLMKLWKKETNPIKVEHLLTKNCNRFVAAKTFSSLLTLKKKNLVQLHNSPDGKIAHISTGESLKSIAD